MDKIVFQNGLFAVKLGPFVDTGRISDPSRDFVNSGFLVDPGAQCKVRVLGAVTVVFSYGRNLHSHRNAFYATALHLLRRFPRTSKGVFTAQASGKFGSAFSAEPASSPASSFGYAAAAIMAALSVERARLGKNTSRPRLRASSSNDRRSSVLAATPPETRIERAPDSSAAASARVTKSLTTVA